MLTFTQLLKYGRVGCLFNHESFYANVQPDDAVQATSFDLANWALWKGIDPTVIAGIRRLEVPPLQFFPLATHSMEEALETSLAALIASHRADNGLATHWDGQLSYLLSPALLAYEMENVSGTSAGSADFQQSIRNAVPAGFSFKGFPMQFSHLSAPRMLADLLRTKIAQDIIDIRGGVDSVRFALRVAVTAYPERVSAVWVMLAVVFAKLDE
jgi:centrosomal protein CEP76